MKDKYVIICGGGYTGYSIAKYLSAIGYMVTIIEQNASMIKKFSGHDIRVVHGNCSDINVLTNSECENADYFIACTQSDEVNVVACELASKVFNVAVKIARVSNQSWIDEGAKFLFNKDILDVNHIITPQLCVARQLYRNISLPGAFYYNTLADGKIALVGIVCNKQSPLINTALSHINSIIKDCEITVAAIVRQGKFIFADTEKDEIMANDRVYFMSPVEDLMKIMEAFIPHYNDSHNNKNVMILGNGDITSYLITQLKQNNFPYNKITVVEKEQDLADQLALSFPSVNTICASPIDPLVLYENNIEDVSDVIAMTNSDNTNILSSLIARKNGARYSSALVRNEHYSPLTGALDIDCVINSQAIILSTIMPLLREGVIRNSIILHGYSAEIMEVQVNVGSQLVGQEIGVVNRLRGIKVLNIVRDNDLLVWKNDTILHTYDILLMIVQKTHIDKVCNLFLNQDS